MNMWDEWDEKASLENTETIRQAVDGMNHEQRDAFHAHLLGGLTGFIERNAMRVTVENARKFAVNQ